MFDNHGKNERQEKRKNFSPTNTHAQICEKKSNVLDAERTMSSERNRTIYTTKEDPKLYVKFDSWIGKRTANSKIQCLPSSWSFWKF